MNDICMQPSMAIFIGQKQLGSESNCPKRRVQKAGVPTAFKGTWRLSHYAFQLEMSQSAAKLTWLSFL